MYIAAFTILSLSFSSCSNKILFLNSTVVPAAEGYIKISKSDNDNYNVDINILHLTEPKKLSPPMNNYVVWIETANQGVKNLGQLNSSSGLFSSTLKAEMHTSTPFKPVRVFITAENSADINYPGSKVVLTTNSF